MMFIFTRIKSLSCVDQKSTISNNSFYDDPLIGSRIWFGMDSSIHNNIAFVFNQIELNTSRNKLSFFTNNIDLCLYHSNFNREFPKNENHKFSFIRSVYGILKMSQHWIAFFSIILSGFTNSGKKIKSIIWNL